MDGKHTMDTYLRLSVLPQCFVLREDFVSPKHWQKEIEAAYVTGGWLDIHVEGEIYHINNEQMLFMSGGALHYYGVKQPQTTVTVVKFARETVTVQTCCDETREKIRALYDQVFMLRADKAVRRIMADMITMAHSTSSFKEYYYCAKLTELTHLLLTRPDLMFGHMRAYMVDNTRHLDAALTFLNENYASNVTLRMLARHLGLTESYCSKYIREKTGMTFIEYLSALRVNYAKQLLIGSESNITEIAYQTGFSSVQTFNRVFRRVSGMSPSEYRRLRTVKRHGEIIQHKKSLDQNKK